jgi:O-antigen ligase
MRAYHPTPLAAKQTPEVLPMYLQPARESFGRIVAMVVLAAVAMTVVLTLGMLRSPLIVLGVVGACVMIAVANRYTAAIMVLCCAAIAFPTSLTGEYSKMAFSTTDALSVLLLFPLVSIWVKRGQLNLGPAGWPLAIYFAVCILATLTGTTMTWGGLGQAVSIGRSALATVVAVAIFGNLGRRAGPWTLPHLCFLSYLLAMPVMTIVMLWLFKQEGFESSMYAFGMNKNGLGPALGCGVVICVSYLLGGLPATRNWRVKTALVIFLILSGLGLVLSLSRGAWIATGAACILIVVCTRNFKAFFAVLAVLVPFLAVIWVTLPPKAISYATNIRSDSSTIQERFTAMNVVMAAFRSNPLLGVGEGLRKDYEPHDVVILTLGETGIVGLASFCLMFAAGFYSFLKARRFCQSAADLQLLVTGSAILLLSITHGLMDVYWRRGIGVFGWVSVGFAVGIMNRPRLRIVGQAIDNSQNVPPALAIEPHAVAGGLLASGPQQ